MRTTQNPYFRGKLKCMCIRYSALSQGTAKYTFDCLHISHCVPNCEKTEDLLLVQPSHMRMYVSWNSPSACI